MAMAPPAAALQSLSLQDGPLGQGAFSLEESIFSNVDEVLSFVLLLRSPEWEIMVHASQ